VEEKSQFSSLLLKWYKSNARSLPWRGHSDPYAVWVSEIMLQQTRVETVIPYFSRWMQRFPDVNALSASSEQDVLNAWEGLGYYSRARSLLKAAKMIVEQFGSQLPHSRESLQKLPGLGRYTAAAIASIAFGLDEVVLDGNVKRVLSRCFNLSEAIDTPIGEKRFWKLAEELLPPGHAGDYNQAVMDLGATICTPKSPACTVCPISAICQARLLRLQAVLPVVTEKKPIPHYIVTAAVMLSEGKVLIARRPSKGLLGGLWEFPGGKVETGESLEAALQREIVEELGTVIEVGEKLGTYRHAYTHFRVTLHAFHARLTGKEPEALEASELAWVEPKWLGEYPMGKIDRMISNDLVQDKRIKN
jgi:A/G-specific adenine glycosylase